jgi:hypothetical protein
LAEQEGTNRKRRAREYFDSPTGGEGQLRRADAEPVPPLDPPPPEADQATEIKTEPALPRIPVRFAHDPTEGPELAEGAATEALPSPERSGLALGPPTPTGTLRLEERPRDLEAFLDGPESMPPADAASTPERPGREPAGRVADPEDEDATGPVSTHAPTRTAPEGQGVGASEEAAERPPRERAPAPAPPKRAPPARPARPKSEAEQRYERCCARVSENPDDFDAVVRLATLCQSMGRTDEALAYYRQAARLDPLNDFVRARLRELGEGRAPAAAGASGVSLAAAIGEALRYPLREMGGVLVAAGALGFGGAALLAATVAPLGGRAAAVALACWFAIYEVHAVRTVCDGRKSPPEPPGAREAAAEVGPALACFLASAGLPLAFAALAMLSSAPPAPAGATAAAISAREAGGGDVTDREVENLARVYAASDRVQLEDARRQARADLLEARRREQAARAAGAAGGVRWAASAQAIAFLVLAACALLLGLAYRPIALLLAARTRSGAGPLQFMAGAVAARSLMPRYAACAVATLGAAGLVACAALALPASLAAKGPVGLALAFAVVGATGVYALLATAHLSGSTLREGRDRVAWGAPD